MRLFTLILVLFLSINTWAVTKATFFGMQVMIQIIPTDGYGSSDSDSVDIYRAMNVPIQDSVMGPGKGIVAANKALNFTCGIRNGSIYECSILLQRSPYTEIDFFNKNAKFEVSGEIAEELRQKFYLNAGEFHFKSSDNVLKIDSTPERFTLQYSQSGI